MFNNEVVQAAAVGSTAYPPGLVVFRKCETNVEFSEYALMAHQLLFNIGEKGLMSIPPNSRKKEDTARWKQVYEEAFKEGGVFAGCKEWDSQSPVTEKFKPLVKGIIKHFSEAYNKREDKEEATLLEQLAANLQRLSNAAANAKAVEDNRKVAQRIQSETVEADMGFVRPMMGVSVPTALPRSINQVQRDAAHVLGQPSQSQSLSRAGKF